MKFNKIYAIFSKAFYILFSNFSVGASFVDNTSLTCDGACHQNPTFMYEEEDCNQMCYNISLWPKPEYAAIKPRYFSMFTKDQIRFKFHAEKNVKKVIKKASIIFMETLSETKNPWFENQSVNRFLIYVTVENSSLELKLDTDEQYSLTIRKEDFNVVAKINSVTYYGARHGLETLSQLIWKDSDGNHLNVFHEVDIKDKPAFKYRGLMVDTARNFFPISQLKQVVKGMAATKLNVLHLHLTDYVSFPISLPSVKELAEKGAYKPEMIYKPEDIQNLREFALINGIRLILEIDAPGHVNEGWNFNNDSLVICGEQDVFKGHLNPDNKEALNVLQKVYGDLINMSNHSELFHIGNDEVDTSCWWYTDAAKQFQNTRQLWVHYTNEMINRLKVANNGTLPEHVIMWSSPLTDDNMNEVKHKDNLVVEFWLGNPYRFLAAGIKVIYATVGHWYLDCGFGPWRVSPANGVCDPYTGWKKFYSYKPWQQYGHPELALGGEACLWTEQVGEDNLETRIWPRAAAMAERLWNDPSDNIDYITAQRLANHRERLITRGLKAAALWPRYCNQNPTKCI